METASVSRSAAQGALRVRNAGVARARGNAEALRRVRNAEALRARNAELGGQLRTAAMEGDDARMARLLAELETHLAGEPRFGRVADVVLPHVAVQPVGEV